MKHVVLLGLAALLWHATPALAQRRPPPLAPMHSDVTAFVGVMVPQARRAVGGAFGGGGSMVRFEIEYSGTVGSATLTRPSAGAISVNVLVQSTPSIHGLQFYGTGGFGLFGETFEGGAGSGEVLAKNFGVGAKIVLAGPLRLRLDYRLFVLGDAPDASPGLVLQQHPQRLSAGLNFTF